MDVAKTMVLVVDRDDDFGRKGGVQTPVIGIEKSISAAMALGTEDPEDSDVNALFAAVNIYKEMVKEGRDVEIALICGDRKVGHKSDQKLVGELEKVIAEIKPDSAILVGDGAEDEYIYPIVSSRLPIDSVRKVYVKQSPNVESFFYIVSKTIREPEKRRRFLGPIGILVTIIALIYLTIQISAYSATESTSYLFGMASPIVVLLIGLIILFYAYNLGESIENHIAGWIRQVRESNISAAFSLLAILMFVVGIILAVYSIRNVYGNSLFYILLQFASSLIWPFGFGFFFNILGKIVYSLVEVRRIEISLISNSIMLFGIMFLLQGIVDTLNKFLGYSEADVVNSSLGVIVGVALMLVASVILIIYKRYYVPSDKEEKPNEV